jgi:hypothetical protein
MFNSLSTKLADRYADRLSGSGSEGRAKKALVQYRRDQTAKTKRNALAALNSLGKNIQADLRSVI